MTGYALGQLGAEQLKRARLSLLAQRYEYVFSCRAAARCQGCAQHVAAWTLPCRQDRATHTGVFRFCL
jgi:hypothetical protein